MYILNIMNKITKYNLKLIFCNDIYIYIYYLLINFTSMKSFGSNIVEYIVLKTYF